ncbi:MAG: hypothetical protein ACOYL3_07025 [Desulfuromonadaceae bacterium]
MGAAVIAGAAVVGAAASVYSASQAGKGGGGEVQETAQGQKAAQIAAEQYNMYLSEVKPTEEEFIADVLKPTGALEGREAGKVNADMAQKSAGYFANNTPDNLMRNLSAPAKAGMALGAAQNTARSMVQDKKIAGLQAIVDIGEGKRSNANLGMSSLAADAQRKSVADAQAKQIKQASTVNAIGSVAGAVGGMARNWPTSPTPEFNSFNGTVPSYNPYTDYSGAGMAGPYATPVTPITSFT